LRPSWSSPSSAPPSAGGALVRASGETQAYASHLFGVSGFCDLKNTATFAGVTDCRLPSLLELESIRDLGTLNPAARPPSNTNCGANSSGNPGCTVTTCRCTAPYYYWSSSTSAFNTKGAWFVFFSAGASDWTFKTGKRYVRAARGGS